MSIVDAAQYLFTSESVTEGHPDKMCDQVSDAILDAIMSDADAGDQPCPIFDLNSAQMSCR